MVWVCCGLGIAKEEYNAYIFPSTSACMHTVSTAATCSLDYGEVYVQIWQVFNHFVPPIP